MCVSLHVCMNVFPCVCLYVSLCMSVCLCVCIYILLCASVYIGREKRREVEMYVVGKVHSHSQP